jgi:hypothetical protein
MVNQLHCEFMKTWLNLHTSGLKNVYTASYTGRQKFQQYDGPMITMPSSKSLVTGLPYHAMPSLHVITWAEAYLQWPMPTQPLVYSKLSTQLQFMIRLERPSQTNSIWFHTVSHSRSFWGMNVTVFMRKKLRFFCTFLDALKAFDKVHHFELFSL